MSIVAWKHTARKRTEEGSSMLFCFHCQWYNFVYSTSIYLPSNLAHPRNRCYRGRLCQYSKLLNSLERRHTCGTVLSMLLLKTNMRANDAEISCVPSEAKYIRTLASEYTGGNVIHCATAHVYAIHSPISILIDAVEHIIKYLTTFKKLIYLFRRL